MGGGNTESKDELIERLLESNRLMAEQLERKKSRHLVTIGVCSERFPRQMSLDPENLRKLRRSNSKSTPVIIHDNMVSEAIKILPEIQHDEKRCYDRLVETAAEYFSGQGLNIVKLLEHIVDDSNLIGCFTYLVEPTDDPPRKFYKHGSYYVLNQRDITNNSNCKYEFNVLRKTGVNKKYKLADIAYYSTVK